MRYVAASPIVNGVKDLRSSLERVEEGLNPFVFESVVFVLVDDVGLHEGVVFLSVSDQLL